MKITLFADRLGRRKPTGIGLYIARLLQYLPIVAPDIHFTAAACHENPLPAIELRPNLSYFCVPGARCLNYLLWSFSLPSLDWIIRTGDLVHALVPIPIGTRKPLVVTVHDLSPILCPTHYTLVSRLVFRIGMHQAITKARHLIADSHHTANDLRTLFNVPPERISVIYLGIDTGEVTVTYERYTELQQKYHLPGRFVFFIGTITYRKNLIVLVKAFARIAGEFPDVHLVLAGNNGLGADIIKATVRDAGLESRIHFPGYIPREDALALMAMAEAFVFPSVYEGFGMPPLEAMAQGTPVVACRGGAIPEIVGDAALLSDPNDIEGLATNLRAVLTDKELASYLRQVGKERVRLFSWEKMARETVEVYRRVLSQ
jgi:glycosyltransferase involved in cell wall biosynthesis